MTAITDDVYAIVCSYNALVLIYNKQDLIYKDDSGINTSKVAYGKDTFLILSSDGLLYKAPFNPNAEMKSQVYDYSMGLFGY